MAAREWTDELKSRARELIIKHGFDALVFTMAPDSEQLDLLDKYAAPIKAWRAFMMEVYAHPDDHEEYNWDETDFYSGCVCFMVALSVPAEDAFSLATFLRYNLQDFDPKLYEKGAVS